MRAEYERERRAKARAAGLCSQCAVRPAEEGKAKCERCREYMRNYQRVNRLRKREDGTEYSLRVRKAVLDAYGGACVCCGETEPHFLAVHHVDGNGKEHREEVGTQMMQWLYSNGFPTGFELRCHNCHLSLHYYGSCPHER